MPVSMWSASHQISKSPQLIMDNQLTCQIMTSNQLVALQLDLDQQSTLSSIIMVDRLNPSASYCKTTRWLECAERLGISLLVEFTIGKVHLWMLLHKLLQCLLLLLFVRGWLAHFALTLVIHHLLNHCSGLAF